MTFTVLQKWWPVKLSAPEISSGYCFRGSTSSEEEKKREREREGFAEQQREQPRARICGRTGGGVGNKYAGPRGLHPPDEDGESGERTSRSMPILAPGFVSRLQPPINTTHSWPSASRVFVSSAAHPFISRTKNEERSHSWISRLWLGRNCVQGETNNGNNENNE